MSTIVTRSGKGSPLTNTEVDTNFTNLNTDKIQSGDTVPALTVTTLTGNGGTINNTSVGATTESTGRFTTITSTATTGTAPLVVASTTPVANLSIGGNAATATTAANVTGTVAVANGGTGQTTYTDGQLLIGNSTGNTLAKATLTAGTGIAITNGNGTISIAATGSGTVTSVTGTSPVNSSGGTTPAISLASGYGDTLNPYASKTANYVLAAPNGSAGVPTFRAVVAADIPTLNQNTTGTASDITATSNSTLTSLSVLSLPYSQLSGTVPTWNQNTTGTASNITATSNSTLTTLSSLSLPGSQVTGNISGNAANVTGTVAVANGGTGATNDTNARSNLSAAKSGANTDITSVTLTTGTISTAPSSSTDIVNKSYADSIASGVNFHPAAQYATTASLGTVTYSNGTSGVGATLTNAGTQATLAIDGYTFSATDVTNATRVLVKNQSTQSQNGVYTVTNQGSGSTNWVLTRATDYDTSGAGTNEVDQGDMVLVINGTANANTSWVQQTPLPITIGTTSIVFVQFAAIQTYTAGTGLTLTTNQFSITSTGTAGTYGSASSVPVFVTNAQGQVTSVTNTAIGTLNQNTTGSAATLTTGRTIAVTGDLAYTSPSFDGSANVTAAGTLATVNTNVGSFTNATLTVNGKGLITAASSGTAPVTSVTATSPVASTGGATPVISMPAATTSVSGYLTSTDWTTFNNKGSGTVTSVAASVPSFLSVAGSPITTSGTLAITYSGTALPILNGGTGQTTANAGLNALLPSQTSNSGKVLSTNGTDASWISASGTGTVTSVAATVPNFLSVSGSPITAAGTLAISYASTPSNGQLLIGNGTGFSYATLTAGTGITVTNGSGTIQIDSTGSGGGVTLGAVVTTAQGWNMI